MKRIFKILVFVFTAILFLTFVTVTWEIGLFINANTPFIYFLSYISTTVFAVALSILGGLGLYKFGERIFKKD